MGHHLGTHRFELPAGDWPSAAEASCAKLFQPVQAGPLHLRHRTWVPAMVPWRATNEGQVTDDVVDWYARFAKGRPGAIVIEATGVRDVPSGPLLRIGHDRYIPGLRRIVEAVREASGGQTRLLIQLIDFLNIRRRPEPAMFFGRYLELQQSHRDFVSDRVDQGDDSQVRSALAKLSVEELERALSQRELSSLRHGYRERVTDTHLPHIAELPQSLPGLFAEAAERAEAAGFDGVELHYAHAYTMASFLSSRNTRDDGYGGDLQARLRLPLEVFQAVRDRVSPKLAVGCRFLSDEIIEDGNRVSDAASIGVAFATAGMDFLSLSRGGKFEDARQPRVGSAAYPYTGMSGAECMPTVRSDERGPWGRNVSDTAQVRNAVRAAGFDTPVVVAGGLCSFSQVEAILQSEQADIIGSARQSIADPDWFRKVHLGEGDKVRRCAFTNYCEGLDQNHKQVTCKLWDRTELDEPNAPKSIDGRRRLLAPSWAP